MNALDVLKYGNLTVLRTLEGVPEPEWYRLGVCGIWSVQEIVAHLTSFEWVLVEVLASLLGDSATPTLTAMVQDHQRFNDDQVALRKGKTGAQVLDEYRAAHARVMELAAQLPAGTFREAGLLPWYGLEHDLDDLIVYQYYGHKREHCAQINVYRDWLEGKPVVQATLQE